MNNKYVYQPRSILQIATILKTPALNYYEVLVCRHFENYKLWMLFNNSIYTMFPRPSWLKPFLTSLGKRCWFMHFSVGYVTLCRLQFRIVWLDGGTPQRSRCAHSFIAAILAARARFHHHRGVPDTLQRDRPSHLRAFAGIGLAARTSSGAVSRVVHVVASAAKHSSIDNSTIECSTYCIWAYSRRHLSNETRTQHSSNSSVGNGICLQRTRWTARSLQRRSSSTLPPMLILTLPRFRNAVVHAILSATLSTWLP